MKQSNKHIIYALLVLLVTDGLVIGYSYLFPVLKVSTIPGKEITLRFMDSDNLFDFRDKTANGQADKLTDRYISDDTLRISRLNKAVIDSAFLPSNDTSYKAGDIREVVLENPEENGVYALDPFFEALIQERDTTVVHIAHYGDSQIEGDRMTGTIRRNLQAKFGGEGPGFIPLEDVATCTQYTRSTSGNWTRYNVFQHKTGSSLWGMSGTLYRFKKSTFLALPDSVTPSGDTIHRPRKIINHKNAFVDLKLSYAAAYKHLKLMYGNSPFACRFKFSDTKGQEKNDTLPASSSFTVYDLPPGAQQFRLEFTGDKSPDFYGLMVDGDNGVQVDNFAIRGHGGGGLMNISTEYLSQQANLLNTRLIIFQYGNNLIPYLESEAECKYFEEVYYKLFMRFRKAIPRAAVLVIGNGDMGTRTEGVNQSYTYVNQLDSVMKNAAIRANCAYWSMLETMGGKNSILTWEKKGLASLDGHLSPKGQQIIANLLFRAIMEEYNRYIIRNKPVTAEIERKTEK